MWDFEHAEISDVIIDFEPQTHARLPVRRVDALARLTGPGSAYARRVVGQISDHRGILDAEHVDRMLLSAHLEMQRLWEEFYHGPRLARVLGAMVSALRAVGIKRRLRIVDVGCGLGFVLRWLAAHRVLDGEVEWVGVDYNAAFIDRATRLAAAEGLPVRFAVTNAFTLQEPADIFLSSGVLHHFRGADLDRFFARQQAGSPLGYAHFDPQQGWAAPVGSFLFHAARMREPLARYDGWLSAARAHPGKRLEAAALASAGEQVVMRYHPPIKGLPIVRTITGAIALPPRAAEIFLAGVPEPVRRISP